MEINNKEKNVPWYREEVDKVLSKEEQKEIVDLAMTELRGVSFPSSLKDKDKLRQNLDEMFNVIGFAKNDYFAKNKITKVCGDIDENHKPFFDRVLQRLKEIIPLSSENKALPEAAEGLIKLLEAYLCVLAYKNTELRNEFKNAKDSDYTLGTFPVRFLHLLNENHKFIYHGDLFLLKNLMNQSSDNRNLGAHNDLDKSFEDVRSKIKLFFSYIVAVNFASLQIYNARNGGVRFYPAKNCSGTIQITIKGEEILKKPWNINYSDKMLAPPVYQWNDSKGKGSGVDCHVVFTPSNGGTPEEYHVTYKKGEFVDVSLGGEKAVSLEVQTQPQKDNNDDADDGVIGVRSTVNFLSLKPVEKPCKGGTFTGTVDVRQLPHGKGLFRRENNYTYDGTFDHGRPMGKFMVKNAGETLTYHGTLANDLTFFEGELIHQDGEKERKYIGIFEDKVCKKGKYYRNGDLKYDGEFGIVDTSEGKNLVYKGKGTIYYEDARYEGEVDKYLPNGEGRKVYKDSSRPIESGWWKDGILIDGYPLADAPEENKTTDDAKQTEERLQSVTASDVINPSETSVDEETIEEEVIDEVSFVEVTIVNQKKLDLTFWCGENVLLILGDKMHCIAGQTIRVTVKDGCTDCEKACIEEHFSLRVPTDVETCEWNLDEEYCQLSKSIREGELTDFDGKLPDGTTYKGKVDAWKRPQGEGLLEDLKNNSYEGRFVDGKLQGKGKRTSYKGVVYKGIFKDGELNGEVERIDEFGKKTTRVYSNGDLEYIKS